MSKKIYILSGLGVDERVFQRLDFSGFSVVFIKWIDPYQNEPIANYARRLCEQISTEKPALSGFLLAASLQLKLQNK